MRPIDADALIFTHEIARSLDDGHNWNELCITADEIADAPTIEPKRGEWKKVKNVHAWDVSGVETWGVKRKCTNCDFRHTFIEDHGHYNFCPNCGAKMKGADDE